MKKIILFVLGAILLCTSIASADYRFNPYTGKLDYYSGSAGGGAFTATNDGAYLDGDVSITGNNEAATITEGGNAVANVTEAANISGVRENQDDIARTFGSDGDGAVEFDATDDVLMIYNKDVRIGDSGVGTYVDGDGDLLVEDELEVGGNAYFNSNLTVEGDLTIGSTLFIAGSGDFTLDSPSGTVKVADTFEVTGDWTLGTTMTQSGGNAYYKGTEVGTGAGGGGATSTDGSVTYVTESDEDFAVGGDDVDAALFFDESVGSLDIDGEFTTGGNNVINFTSAANAEIQITGTKVMDLTTSGAFITGGNSTYIQGLGIAYASTTSVEISAGSLVVNDTYISIDASTSTVSVFDNGGYTYLMVDGDDVTNPTMYWSTTDPTEQTDGTFYIGNDRCIGAFYCDGAAAIDGVMTTGEEYAFADCIQIGSDMDPDGSWQAPDDFESSAKLPVNAIEVDLYARAYDSGSECYASLASYEASESTAGAAYTNGAIMTYGYVRGNLSGRIALGASRNIRVSGINDDDNYLNTYITGYKIRR